MDMNTQELILKTVEFFFDNTFHFLGLIIFILTIKGTITNAFQGISRFFKAVVAKYRAKVEEQRLYNVGLKTRPFTDKDKLADTKSSK